MAAYFVFKEENGVVPNYTWHVGNKLPFNITELSKLDYVQIDGHEAEILYGFGFEFNGDRVHKLSRNESILYVLLMQERYKDNPSYNDIESKINILLEGEQNPKLN
tara:strand:+ start:219 stop:536 length:318 start_codon:yes stop_codon:yes gene_type:complete